MGWLGHFHMGYTAGPPTTLDHDLARHRADRERGTELVPRHQAGPGCSRLRPAAESYSHVRLDSSDQGLGLSVYAGVARHYNMQWEAVLGGDWFAILRITTSTSHCSAFVIEIERYRSFRPRSPDATSAIAG